MKGRPSSEWAGWESPTDPLLAHLAPLVCLGKAWACWAPAVQLQTLACKGLSQTRAQVWLGLCKGLALACQVLVARQPQLESQVPEAQPTAPKPKPGSQQPSPPKLASTFGEILVGAVRNPSPPHGEAVRPTSGPSLELAAAQVSLSHASSTGSDRSLALPITSIVRGPGAPPPNTLIQSTKALPPLIVNPSSGHPPRSHGAKPKRKQRYEGGNQSGH